MSHYQSRHEIRQENTNTQTPSYSYFGVVFLEKSYVFSQNIGLGTPETFSYFRVFKKYPIKIKILTFGNITLLNDDYLNAFNRKH